jgi:hypothetical protein
MTLVNTSKWRRLRAIGAASLRWKQFLLVPVIGLALAPGMMGPLSHVGGAVADLSTRKVLPATIGGGSRALQAWRFTANSDGDGGPPVP